jgi:GNAT superfamily N-acetyltransferase
MYVADLVSMPAERSKGYGNQIFDYLEDTAKKAGCTRYQSSLELPLVSSASPGAHCHAWSHRAVRPATVCSLMSVHVCRLLLESNVERGRAHKFYFKKGLMITSYRFAKNL